MNLEKIIKIRKPDDFHIHLREGNILKTILPYIVKYFGRGLIMPNLIHPINTIKKAILYKKKIQSAIPKEYNFIPLMSCFLTESLKKETIINGYTQKVFISAKLYPINVTTNSSFGVSNLLKIYPLLYIMEKIGMPLSIHGEVTDEKVDIFDREARFIEKFMNPIRKTFPNLKIVLEHISTKESVDYVLNGDKNLAATITPHHLFLNRNHMLKNKICPHLYCFPILNKRKHQQALQNAISNKCNRIFLGTDSAPHIKRKKESNFGLAGIFNSLVAIPIYAEIFEDLGVLDYLENFCSLNGSKFYNLPVNEDFIELQKKENIFPEKILVNHTKDSIISFLPNRKGRWILKEDKKYF